MTHQDEIAEMFKPLSVPTYECIGYLGSAHAWHITKAVGIVFFGENSRRVGRDPIAKQKTDAAYRERHHTRELKRKHEYRQRPEVRERERLRSSQRAAVKKEARRLARTS